MTMHVSRRGFLHAAGTGSALAGLGSLAFLDKLPAVSAAEAQPDPKSVQFTSDIEPLVRLVEETPREKLLEAVAGKIKSGTSYREVVAALLLAGVRNVQPRPSVGFKFHAVLVVNSAHLASMAGPDEHRWLPIFWALDHFKEAQAQDTREGNWTMAPIAESKLPTAHRARFEFTAAMDKWDEERADLAVAALVRTRTSGDLFDLFCRYGARDQRSIGHKMIYVANAWRTLHCIGWQYAEPVLRSLTYALLNHQGEGNPAENDFEADRSWRRNQEWLKMIGENWLVGEPNEKSTAELLMSLRSTNSEGICEEIMVMLEHGVAPQSIWDALFCGSGELLMRQPGIVGLHTLTTTNAFRYAFDASASEETRALLLLQAAAWLPTFREAMKRRGKVGDAQIDQLEAKAPKGEALSLDQIFREVSDNRGEAARSVLGYSQGGGDVDKFIQQARVQVFLKGRDAHDYKFSSAVLEDYRNVSPAWRDRYLAASVYNLRGSGGGDNPLVQRTRQALGAD